MASIVKNHLFPFLIAFSLGLYFVSFNIFGEDMIFIPGDLGDARFNLYVLEYNHQFFVSGDTPNDSYWDAPFMYPQESILSFSDNLLGTFPIYSFFRSLGADKYVSFQWWYLSLLFLNYFASYFLLFWITKNPYSSALGAFLFTFSIALFGQLAHAQTYPRFPIPLAILSSLLYLKQLNSKYFLLSLLLLIYQFYCAIYLGFLLSIPIAILLLSVLFQREFYSRIQEPKWIGQHIIYLFIALGLLAPLIIPYIQSPARIESSVAESEYSYHALFENIPTFRSYFFLDTLSYFWSSLSEGKEQFEKWWQHQLFPGISAWISAIALLFLVLFKKLRKRTKPKAWQLSLLLSACITFILFLRIGEFTLYRLLYEIPGFYAIRAIDRIINVELIFFAIALGLFSKLIFAKFKKLPWIPFLILLAFLVADNYVVPWTYPSYKIAISEKRVGEIEESLLVVEKGKVISFEPQHPSDTFYLDQIDAMLAAQSNFMYSVNGYSSKCAEGFCDYFNEPTAENRKKWLLHKGMTDQEVIIVDRTNDH